MSDGAAPGAHRREAIREQIRATGRRLVVFDDDPTGSQSVHDVEIVTVAERGELAAALAAPGSTCFVLTNTRSLDPDAARAANAQLTTMVCDLEGEFGAPIDLVSRSDSTLRGHVLGEISTIEATRRALTGEGFDAVIFAPAFLEAGRFTEGDVHFARVGGQAVPVGATEFARDVTFGYESSNLREFLVEVSGGSITSDEVTSISLADLEKGPDRVAELLSDLGGHRYVVANAREYADLEVLALGALRASAAGRRFLYRSGPSLVRALSGNEPRAVLGPLDVYPDGPPSRHGLVVVGSHVGLTNAQLEVATTTRNLVRVELLARELEGDERDEALIDACAQEVRSGLAYDDVLLVTSRELRLGANAAESLAMSRRVSSALVEVVRRALPAKPAFVCTKGGITSHDVAVRALEIRRALVVGQLLPGMVSLFRPIEAAPEAIGIPFVVFAGNVGDEDTLDAVIGTLRGES